METRPEYATTFPDLQPAPAAKSTARHPQCLYGQHLCRIYDLDGDMVSISSENGENITSHYVGGSWIGTQFMVINIDHPDLVVFFGETPIIKNIKWVVAVLRYIEHLFGGNDKAATAHSAVCAANRGDIAAAIGHIADIDVAALPGETYRLVWLVAETLLLGFDEQDDEPKWYDIHPRPY